MRRIVHFLIITSLLYTFVSTPEVLSASRISPDTTPEDVLREINRDMQKLYFPDEEDMIYFPESTENGRYRQDLIQQKIADGSKDGKYHFQIVYGKEHGEKLNHKGQEMMEYSGYSVHGDSVSTEGARWYAGWSGKEIQNFNMIKEPWIKKNVHDKYGIEKNDFDYYINKSNPHLPDGTFEQSIIEGLNITYGNGKKYGDEHFMYNDLNSEFKGLPVYTNGSKPKKGNWIDYVHVLQPPTTYAWGYGTIYIQGSGNRITYMDIWIAPFSLQETYEDLAATFEKLPSRAAAGEQVTVGVKVKSTFTEPVTPAYRWGITDAAGNSLDVEYTGDAAEPFGHLTIPGHKKDQPQKREQVLYAQFTMPDSEVKLTFAVNEDGSNPEESNLTNNVIQDTISLIQPQKLPYDALSMEKIYPLADGQNLTAQLTLPRGKWISKATGALKVSNLTPDLLREFKVTNNDPINEDGEMFERTPIIHTTINRKDFGDDPVGGNWLNPSDPDVPLSRYGEVSYEGTVTRHYEYTWQDCHMEEGADGKPKQVCETKYARDKATASFPSGTDRQKFDMYVHNGRQDIPKPKFRQEIEQNEPTSDIWEMWWENEPYPYRVIRWMNHLNAKGEPDNWTVVDGQYERIFTQQAHAKITWQVESKMKQEYDQARTAAKNGKNRKSLYDKAVFATDRQLQRYDYPVKSGYYFNPAGRYTFTVETVTYKPTTEDTPDHQDLVDALIKAFRYETDLMYIDSTRTAVTISNDPLESNGRGGFNREFGVLSAENNIGVDGKEHITVLDRKKEESRYTKQVDEIYHSQNRNGKTHEYWKKVLEGYSESGTQDSESKYSYREYVKDGQHMYRITEKTEVTIVMNLDNENVYTHANMPDGDYMIRAWFDPVDLSKTKHAYKRLGILQGIPYLDEIKVTVKGSMYDDLNN